MLDWGGGDCGNADRRVERLAARYGCAPDIESLAEAVFSRIDMEDVGFEPVRLSVEHLLSDDRAWQSVAMGVVPPSLRAKALCGLARSSPTAPGDALVAAVCAELQAALDLGSEQVQPALTIPRTGRWQSRPAFGVLGRVWAGRL